MIGDDTRRNPYVALRPFDEDDALYFYGRRRNVDALLDILREQHLLAIVGSPGSGKTSLMNAGLRPAMLGGLLDDVRDGWHCTTITPGDAPLANLAAGLLGAMGDAVTPATVADLAGEIRTGGAVEALHYLKPRLDQGSNLGIFVDEFESIFTFRDGDAADPMRPGIGNMDWTSEDPAARADHARRKEEASIFVDVLLRLAAQSRRAKADLLEQRRLLDSARQPASKEAFTERIDRAEERRLPVYVTFAIAAGFVGHCDLFRHLPEALNNSRYLVPRMTREQLRDAVECPALLKAVEGREYLRLAPPLVDVLLNATGDSLARLPVLFHALKRAFDEWEKEEKQGILGPIDLRHLRKAGGLVNVIALDADGAVADLDPVTTDTVLRRLVAVDSKGLAICAPPVRIADIVADTGIPAPVVITIAERLGGEDRNFVIWRPAPTPDDGRVAISHEAVILNWPLLLTLVERERTDRDSYIRTATRAVEWRAKQGDLLRGPELHRTVGWWNVSLLTAGWAERYPIPGGGFILTKEYIERSRRDPPTSIPVPLPFVLFAGFCLCSALLFGLLWKQAGPVPSSPPSFPLSCPTAPATPTASNPLPIQPLQCPPPPVRPLPDGPGPCPGRLGCIVEPEPGPDLPPPPSTCRPGQFDCPQLGPIRWPPDLPAIGPRWPWSPPSGPPPDPEPDWPGSDKPPIGPRGFRGPPPSDDPPPVLEPLLPLPPPAPPPFMPVPDAATWVLMIAGFGLVGAFARRRRGRWRLRPGSPAHRP